MRVLFLHAYYEPEIAASLYLYSNLAEDLAESGHEVVVIAPTPTRGVSKAIRRLYSGGGDVKLDACGRYTVRRLKFPPEGKHPVWRAIRYVLLEIRFLAAALTTEFDIAFLASTPPTQGLVAAAIRRIKKKPVLYHVQDLFPESLVSTGFTSKDSVLWRLGQVVQQITYRNVSRVLTISESLRQQIVRAGVPDDTVSVVYNWVDESEVVPVPRHANSLFERFGLDRSKTYVSYCGNLGHTQNLELLVRVARSFMDADQVHFVIVGEGAHREQLESLANGMPNFHIFPFQPYSMISEVFSLGDIGLVISKSNVGANSVPSKAWSIMAAARPLLSSFDLHSDLTKMIASADAGMSVAPDDEEALRRAICFLADTPRVRSQYGTNGRQFVLQNLTRKPSTRKIRLILESMQLREAGHARTR